MKTKPSYGAIVAALVGVTALSGCLGSNSGGGGGGTGTTGTTGGTTGTVSSASSYQALYNSKTDATVLANAPTSDMPSSGTAKYTGTVYLNNIADAGTQTNVVATDVLGDADLTVTFAQSGQSAITGTVDNVRGKDATGADFAWTTSFDTAHANGSGTLLTTESTINAPVVGPITTRTGAMNVVLGADITAANAPELNTTGTALLSLGGNMQGSGATHSTGVAQITIDDDNVAGIIDWSGAGTYVVEKQ
jgi:hypothetical protein